MGLDFSFFLTFPKARMWDALDGVIALAEPGLGSTTIRFPDGDRSVPLPNFGYKKQAYSHDDPEFSFATSLRFPEDEVILDYVRQRDGADVWRGPPDDEDPRSHSIGFIYLYLYADLKAFSSDFTQQDLIAMNFVAAGTTMSLVFSESISMRKTFSQLLQRHDGIYGILNRELEADLFWWRGESLEISIGSIYTAPQEVDATVRRIKAGGLW